MRCGFLSACLVTMVLFAVSPGMAESGTAPTAKEIVVQKLQPHQKRVALVIGNSRYSSSRLTTPANDSHVLAAALRRYGFEVVEKSNLDRNGLNKALTAFSTRLKGAEIGLFYYAGHGIQAKGKNYLVPVGVKISSENQVSVKTVPVDPVVTGMKNAGIKSGILILDASRNNPPGRSAVGVRGLAPMEAPDDFIIAFSAAPGKTVDEGDATFGAYTEALIQAMDFPGLPLDKVFQRVRSRVEIKSNSTQVPWEHASLTRNDISIVPPFEPSGTQLRSDPAAPTARALRGFNESFSGMEFVPVPGGCYYMGNSFGDGFPWEQPVHTVCVSDFSIGKFEVTQEQWRRVIGNTPSHFGTCGDDCPVDQVSWEDVQTFISKLNEKVHGNFRLPSEAEWEYAARSGGKNEKFSGGDDVDAVAWHKQNAGETTHPAGTKKANGLGIYDMSGNVWEWVQDWYDKYSSERQDNPTGPATGTFRVFRGGSWSQIPDNARTAIRFYNTPDVHINFLGFRLAAPAVR